jgi:hypothetical protein
MAGNSFTGTSTHMEQRQRLGIVSKPQQSPNPVHHSPATVMEKVEVCLGSLLETEEWTVN